MERQGAPYVLIPRSGGSTRFVGDTQNPFVLAPNLPAGLGCFCTLRGFSVANFHCDLKPIQRSKNHNAVAHLSYILRCRLVDQEPFFGDRPVTYDFSKKSGLAATGVFGWNGTVEELANAMEQSENRTDSVVGRKIISALPFELTKEQNIELCNTFAAWIADTYSCAVVYGFHNPDSARGENEKNYHVHLDLSRRRVAADKRSFNGETISELDEYMYRGSEEVTRIRAQWEEFANRALEAAGSDARIDGSRTDKPEELKKVHMGPEAHGAERRGEKTSRGDYNKEVDRRRAKVEAEQKLDLEDPEDLTPERIADLQASENAELRRLLQIALDYKQELETIEQKIHELEALIKAEIAEELRYLNRRNAEQRAERERKDELARRGAGAFTAAPSAVRRTTGPRPATPTTSNPAPRAGGRSK